MTLNDGSSMPVLGLGTWPFDDAQAERIVFEALAVGYRHIDTAVRYGNEVGVGRAVAASGLRRDEVFVTTKLDGEFQGADLAVAGLAGSLERLGLAYVDLLLIHWPLPQRERYVSTWRTFERLAADGLARSIGVSNFKPEHLKRLADETSVTPAVNQIQLHPYAQRRDHRAYHERHGIATVSYTPLARDSALLSERVLTEAAANHGKSPAQVVLRWHLQHGTIVIPKTSKRERMVENASLFDFVLSDAEMAAIDELDEQQNYGFDPREMSDR